MAIVGSEVDFDSKNGAEIPVDPLGAVPFLVASDSWEIVSSDLVVSSHLMKSSHRHSSASASLSCTGEEKYCFCFRRFSNSAT